MPHSLLNTMSSSLNSLGATLFEDFVRPRINNKNVSDETINKIIKVVVIIGAICLLFVFIVDKFGNLFQGVLAGSITSLLAMSWIIYKAQEAIAVGSFKLPLLPTSIEGCGFNTTLNGFAANETLAISEDGQEAFILYRLSFMYYTTRGLIITTVVGVIVSQFTEPPPPEKLKPILFTPFVREMDNNSTTDDSFGVSLQFFGWLDFTFFLSMLGVSMIIGIYFGFWGKKEETPKEYLHGGKTMSTLPVAVSLVSSSLSGVTMMGIPTEIYRFGTLYWNVIFAALFMALLHYYFLLPVFYELQLTSTYEYLEMRFNRRVRVMASVLYTISLLLFIPIVVYVPALVLSQVSGVNLHIITVGTSVLCVFYTMLGGLKAVVWTDFLQGLVMVIFNPNPFIRLTSWAIIVGQTFNWLSYIGVNQSIIQKFMSLPTFEESKRSLIFCAFGLMLIKIIVCFIGLLIYAAYYNCDPIKSKAVSRPDQLASYYVMDIAFSMPGLPGLFVAGIFSAALSTMSSSMNSLGATLFEDFVRPRMNKNVSDETINKIIKGVVIIIGAICLLFVFIVDKFGNILQLTVSVIGVTSGPVLGLFTFGMFYPRGNTQGVLAGSITSLLAMSWIIYKAQEAIAVGSFKLPLLPTSIEGCGFNTTLNDFAANETLAISEDEEEAFILYRVSFMYYTILGLLITIIVGVVVSLFTERPPPEKLKPILFTPFISFMYYTFLGLIITFIVGVIVSHITEPAPPEKQKPVLFTPFVRRFLKAPERLNNDPAVKELIEMTPIMDTNSTTEHSFERNFQYFGWLDFALFLAMLGVSTLIGVYFGFWGKKEETPKEYLHGGKTMSTLPVAVSLVSSSLSGVTMMGTPTEIYRFGTIYWNVGVSAFLMGMINYYCYLPVFYELQITSTYEGGLKAVVWTDFLQGIVMVVSSLAVIILGVIHAGGFGAVWQRNEEGGRINLYDMNPNPFVRATFWSVSIGTTFNWLTGIAVGQAMVQKFMSLPTLTNAKRSLIFCTLGILLIKSIVCYLGLLIYSAYYDCDPIQTKAVTRPDQLASYYVMDIATMSSSLNSLGATLFEDFVRPCIKKSVSDATVNKIIKCVLTVSVGGVTNGAMLGLFTFGMFYPRGNTKGVLAGSITSLLCMAWIIFKAQEAISDGRISLPLLPTSVEGCDFNVTTSELLTNKTMAAEVQEEAFILYRVSFMYYTTLGLIITMVVGVIVSLFTEPPPPEKQKPVLFTPFVRRFLKTPEKMSNDPAAKELIKLPPM
ncbi:hypothetical protein C0J52_02919 [Blattella germanica]|nr:hypothetical protein C0J52_02919 [Blattella germanica]